MSEVKLTAKQEMFCREYLIDLNGTQAAIRAGYKENAARQSASENLSKPHIADFIAELKAERNKEVKIDAKWVLSRLAMLADFNINRFLTVNKEGLAFYDFSTATDDDWYCISEYTADTLQKREGEDFIPVDRVKLKGIDKLKALELVGRHVDVRAFEGEGSSSEENSITKIQIEVIGGSKDTGDTATE